MDDLRVFRRIGLYGPFGWGNLGDASIQEAVMHNIRKRRPEAEFRGISLRPDNTEEIHGIPSFPITRKWAPRSPRGAADAALTTAPPGATAGWKARIRAIPVLGPLVRGVFGWASPLREALRELRFMGRAIRFLRSLDLFILSGGGQLSDDWGGPWEHPYSILKWTVCARLAGCRVYVISVGAGPFLRAPTPFLLRTALRLAHYRSYRDRQSYQLVAPWGFTRRDPVYPDLAFSLPPRTPIPSRPDLAVAPDPGPSIPDAENPAPSRPLVVGVSPMSYYLARPGSWPDLDDRRYDRYRKVMLQFTTRVLKQGHSVVLLCSVIGSDHHAFDDLVDDLGAAGLTGGDTLQTVHTRSLSHLLEQIAGIDILVTSRLHGVILSYLHQKPAIALSYDPKIESVMEDFGQSSYCLEIGEATTEQLTDRFQALRGELPGAGKRILGALIENRTRLEDQFDRLFGPPREGVFSGFRSGAAMTGSHRS